MPRTSIADIYPSSWKNLEKFAYDSLVENLDLINDNRTSWGKENYKDDDINSDQVRKSVVQTRVEGDRAGKGVDGQEKRKS